MPSEPKKAPSPKKKVSSTSGTARPAVARPDRIVTRTESLSARVSNRTTRETLESAPASNRGELELPYLAMGDEAALAPTVDRPILPAWVASYTNPGTLSLLHGGAEAFPESIIPTVGDDRQQVTDTQNTPWRWLCRLDITSANGQMYIGTGWLVDPKTVITAGHCVYMHDDGGWAKLITVTPAYNDADAPYGSFESSDLHSTSGWVNGNPDDESAQVSDYAAIILPQSLTLGFFGYEVASDDDLVNVNVNVYGYPGDKDQGAELWGNARKLVQVGNQRLFYDIATFGGQSGSPVFVKDGDQRTAVGIHNYGGTTANKATRITDEVFDNIESWKAGKD